MKHIVMLVLSAALFAGALPARAAHAVILAGLVNLTNYQAALLIITDSPPDAAFATCTHKWVVPGEDFDDANLLNPTHIVIEQIDFTNCNVQATENKVSQLYVPATTNVMTTTEGNYVSLENAPFDDVLDLYAALIGRTMLVHPGLPRPPVTLSDPADGPAQAVAVLKNALQNGNAVLFADGSHFEWLVPAQATASSLPVHPDQPRPTAPPNTNSLNTFPVGSIDFDDAGLPQVMAVYQALTGQKWVQSSPPPGNTSFTFHNQTSLTKPEALHVFNVLLAWHGLRIASRDGQSFDLVPITTASAAAGPRPRPIPAPMKHPAGGRTGLSG